MSDNSRDIAVDAEARVPRVVRHGPFPVQFRQVTVQRVERIARASSAWCSAAMPWRAFAAMARMIM